MEEIKFGVVFKRRSFPFGEGEGGWGLMNGPLSPEGGT